MAMAVSPVNGTAMDRRRQRACVREQRSTLVVNQQTAPPTSPVLLPASEVAPPGALWSPRFRGAEPEPSSSGSQTIWWYWRPAWAGRAGLVVPSTIAAVSSRVGHLTLGRRPVPGHVLPSITISMQPYYCAPLDTFTPTITPTFA